MSKLRTISSAICFGIGALSPMSASAVAVDLELVLMTDVSGSVSVEDFDQIRTGYRNAFQSASF